MRKIAVESGISLITLIITIIVIIILASIVIFSGLNTPDRAGYAKFVSELEDIQTYVTNKIANEKGNNIIKGTVKSNAQLAYMVATGTDSSSAPANPTPAGTVASLGKTILPEGLQGTNYYEITNSDVLSTSKSFYQAGEKHYITDKGEVFIWPGYLVEEDNGSKWYVNQKKYYLGEGTTSQENESAEGTIATSNIEIGDYVMYSGDGSYTLLSSKTGYSDGYTNGELPLSPETATWRVWDIKSNGDIVIIPNAPVNSFYLSGDIGFINCVQVIEGVCDMYTNSSLGVTNNKVDSLTIEELEKTKISNIATLKWKYKSGSIEYGKTYQQIYGGNGYTSGTFLTDDDGKKIANEPRTASTSSPINMTQTYYYLDTSSGQRTSGEKLVWTPLEATPKTGITSRRDLLSGYISWLASPCVRLLTSSIATFEVRVVFSGDVSAGGLSFSNGGATYISYGVRPLVTLSSSLQVVGGNANSGMSGTPWVFKK